MTIHARTYAATIAAATPDQLVTTIAAVRARLLAAHLIHLGPVLVEVFTGDECAAAASTVEHLGMADSPLLTLFRACPDDVVLVVAVVQVPNSRDRWN